MRNIAVEDRLDRCLRVVSMIAARDRTPTGGLVRKLQIAAAVDVTNVNEWNSAWCAVYNELSRIERELSKATLTTARYTVGFISLGRVTTADERALVTGQLLTHVLETAADVGLDVTPFL